MEPTALARFLKTKVPSAENIEVTGVARIGMGASRETWAFDAAWSENGTTQTREYVLRRDTDVGVVETPLRYEYDVYLALQGTGLPVPEMFWWEESDEYVGRSFFVSSRIAEGDANPFGLIHDPTFAEAKEKLGHAFVDVLAGLHRIDPVAQGFTKFMDPVAVADSASTQVDVWEDTLNRVELEPNPVFRGVIAWLREHLPAEPERLAVVHGDARVGNFMATGDGRLTAMLDWELAHLGDAREDVGWSLHFDVLFGGSLIHRDEFIRTHAEKAGIAVDEEAVRFWEVLAGLKLAIIFLTGIKSFADGSPDITGLGFMTSTPGAILQAVKRMEVPGVSL